MAKKGLGFLCGLRGPCGETDFWHVVPAFPGFTAFNPGDTLG